MARLWRKFGGEPFLTNPRLFVLNPEGKKMRLKRDSKGRFLKRHRSNPVNPPKRHRRRHAAAYHPRRRHARHNPYLAANRPRRRRHARRNPYLAANPRRRRHRARSNPGFSIQALGLNTPTLKTAGYTVIGVAGTPFLEGFIRPVIPATWLTNPLARYAVKIASAIGVGFLVKQIFGVEAGKAALVGGLAYIGTGAIQEFFPTLLAPSMGRYLPPARMGAQPLLGNGMSSAITARVPERLNPANRF